MRFDLEIISSFVKPNSRILDIGCGDGVLLNHLQKEKRAHVRGIELNSQLVSKAMHKGLSIIQGDADNDLAGFPGNAVDYAILSQTLQATKDPKQILVEMRRIAEYSIVSVPNFGYWQNRLYFMLKGRMPVTKTLSYEWYDTPNIHFCTIKDFVILVKELGFKIEKQVFINEKKSQFNSIKSAHIANLFCQYGIFLLKRGIVIKSSHKESVGSKLLNMNKVAVGSSFSSGK